MKKICIQCGEEIETSRRWKYCSHKCYANRQHYDYIAHNPLRGESTTTTGAISELRVAVDLMAKGYHVFRALSPACPCDLAVLKSGDLLRVEVRTAQRLTSGKLIRNYMTRDDTNNIDIYAWVLPTEIIYEPGLKSY